MAELNLKYNTNIDTYSDGDIENTILSIVKEGIDISLTDKKYPYAVVYHLSRERENILNWYNFDKTGTCLEIGAGCGAITGLLCQKCKKVVSVDISPRRCQINFERHKDIDNLEIFAGNFQEIDFCEKFDYVILNGVFEYALSFIHTQNNPYIEFLEIIKKQLSSTGKIFIAIENRLGLKYFNGATEDHTDNYFLGLNNYENNNSVRTFSKSELSAIIKKAGFENFKFYYPYPDYKFPSEIFTDETINQNNTCSPYMNLNNRTFALYSESKVSKSLTDENVADIFSNSFLVEIYNEGKAGNTLYTKINSLRKDNFKILTSIIKEENNKTVYKIPLTESAQKHIQNMYSHFGKTPEKVLNLKGEKIESGIKYPFLKQKNLNDYIYTLIKENNKEAIIKALTDFFKLYKALTVEADFENQEFKKVFGNTSYNGKLACISSINTDLICNNIFLNDDGTYTIIDNEWVFDFNIPLQFIIWKCINELYYKNNTLENIVSKNEMLSVFKINDKMYHCFNEWAIYFADTYVGNNYLLKYSHPVEQISLMDVYNKRASRKNISTSFYLDKGNGFNENDKIFDILHLDDNGDFELTVSIPENTRALRWDITEDFLVKCKIYSDKNVTLTAINAENQEEYDAFYTKDPQYIINNFTDMLTIKGNIKYISYNDAYNFFMNNTLQLADNVSQLTQSLSFNNSVLMLKDRYIAGCEQRIAAYQQDIYAVKAEKEQQEQEIAMYKQYLSSKAWKLVSKIWCVTGFLKKIKTKIFK